MSEDVLPAVDTEKVPKPIVKRGRRFSVIWLIPLTAAAVGAWLWYRSIVEAGVPIVLCFEDGSGIEAGKTHIRYKGMAVGVVDRVELRRDFGGIEVHATLDKSAEGLARENSVFWLVKPRVNLAGISGLETLVSGAYIAVRPGGGRFRTEFTALREPPTVDLNAPGLHLFLLSKTLGSLLPGTPVYFRKMQVGSVQDHCLSGDGESVRIRVHIQKKFASLVGENTRFWNASGITVKAGLSGVKLRTESVAALLVGGVAFDTPEGQGPGKAVQNGHEFKLFPDYESAVERGVPVTIAFSSGNGIGPGAAVKYRGLVVGKVKDVDLAPQGERVVVKAVLDESAKHLAREGAQFWVVKPHVGFDTITGLETILTGRYIAVRPGTGEAKTDFVGLDSPPRRDPSSPGLHIDLEADSLGSIEIGSPILYRRVPVGEIDGYELREGGRGVKIHMHIGEKYAHLVRKNSRFYNVSGLSVKASLTELKVHTESLGALLSGGVAFLSPRSDAESKPSKDGDTFRLYRDREEALEEGLRITIYFTSGTGLRQSAPIRYHGLDVGEIKSVRLNESMSGVAVEARLDESASDLAREGSMFWVVKPEIDLSGVSGLETLLTGRYIQVRPGSGKRKTAFVGLDEPPLRDPKSPGLHVSLTADRLGSLGAGSPVYYRNIPVGEVEGHELRPNDQGVRIYLHIDPQYASLVKKSSRFYNASGISVTAGLSGVKVRTESLATLISGGVGFLTAKDDGKAKPSRNGDSFELYPDYESAKESVEENGTVITIAFRTGGGLRAGETEIKYLGMTVGKVKTVALNKDMRGVTVTARLAPSAADLAREGTQFWLVKPEVGLEGIRGLETIVTGTYIQARPGHGARTTTFLALESPPATPVEGKVPGLNIVLLAHRLGSVKPGVPVYYREIKVGQVGSYELAPTGNGVLIHASVRRQFAPLVRENSVFWNASGIGVEVNLLGAKIRTQSLEAIVRGGVAFATPGGESTWLFGAKKALAPPVSDGAEFVLHDTLKKKWLEWNPVIPLDSTRGGEK